MPGRTALLNKKRIMATNEKQVITILMLGGSRRVSLAEQFMRSGKSIGCEVRFVAYELDTDVPIALVGKVVKGLSFSDPDVVDDIIRVVEDNDVRIILPIVNGAMEVASLLRERLPHVFVPVSDFEVTSTLYDKVDAAAAYAAAGFPIPKTYTVIDNDMPAIVKPRKGSRSRGVRIFYDINELMSLANLDSYLIQEYIEDAQEYTVDCYVDRQGDILVTVPRERLEIMGGEVTRTVTRNIPELVEMSRKVLKHFGLTGPVTVQFLHDPRTDRYMLMEVNPRLGGGVICSIYAGAPITDYILKEALEVPVRMCDDWIPNVLMARYQKEAIFFER